MPYGDRVPDKEILKKVNQKLTRTGVGQSKITVTVRNGNVTIAGEIQYEIQRKSIMNAARSVAGIKGIIDQLKAPSKKR